MATQIITAQSLVDDTRLMSDLKNNQVCTDDEITGYLSDAGSELYDIFTAENEHYNIKPFDFSLSGGVGDSNGINSWDLSGTPGDFQQGHSLELNPLTPNPITVHYLSNWLNRNNYAGGIVFAGNSLSKQYCFSGTLLKVFPAMNAAGTYRLWYTPIWTPLALVEAVPGTNPAITSIGTAGQYDFSGATFTTANIGDSLVVTGAANAANNGSFTITSTPNANAIIVNNPNSVNEGSGATATVQPAGTTSTLIAQMNPWALYLKLHASITIRNKRDQNVDEFWVKLNALKGRIASILQNRQEEPTQPPLTRGNGAFDDWLF